MEITYKVRGADGAEYGPATLDQLSAWLREGRVQPQSEVLRSDQTDWAAADRFAELFPPAAPDAPVNAPAPTVASADPGAVARLKSGASWFYWIAALSLINSIAAFSGSSWRFFIGLGITQIFDEIGHGSSGSGKMVALALNLVVTGICALFGVFANKGHVWAFVIGMVFFALDGAIFLIAEDWIGVGFHVFVLYCLFRGVQACRQLKAR